MLIKITAKSKFFLGRLKLAQLVKIPFIVFRPVRLIFTSQTSTWERFFIIYTLSKSPIYLSFIHIYHFDTLSLAVWQDTCHTYKNLVYDLTHHESPIAQRLERPTGIWKVMGPTPVGGSENSFSEYFDLRTLLHYCSFRYGIPQHSTFFRTVYFSEGFVY